MADPELISKFMEMTKDFKSKSEGLMTEITTLFTQNMEAAGKNYVELQNTYANGYNGITQQSQKANGSLLESMDKNYGELKKQMGAMYTDLQSKANQAVDGSTKEFETQCADITKKYPNIPEKAYKDVLKGIVDAKGKVNSELEKKYKDALEKIDKNFASTKKELTMPEPKIPKLPSLDISAAGGAAQALTAAMNHMSPLLKNLADNLPKGKK